MRHVEAWRRAGAGLSRGPVRDLQRGPCGAPRDLAALYVRERTGRGQKVDATLVQGWRRTTRGSGSSASSPSATRRPSSRAALLRAPRADPELRVSPPRMLDARRSLAAVLADLAAPLREFMHVLGSTGCGTIRVEDGARVRGRGERERFWERMLTAARERPSPSGRTCFGAPERMGRALPEHEESSTTLRWCTTAISSTSRIARGHDRQLAPIVRMTATPAAYAPGAAPGEHTGSPDDLEAVGSARRRASVRRRFRERPLDGVTVVELGLWYAGPSARACSQISAHGDQDRADRGSRCGT
jgi:hypothetical protein